jgi:hypothetical protein
MRAFTGAFCVAIACWILTACGSFTGPTVHDIPGEYALVTYDGKPLPYRIDSALTVTSDTLFLNTNGVYTEIVAYTHTNGDVSVIRYAGRYSFDGAEIIVTFDNGGGFILEIPDKRTLTENDGNGIIVYQKPS